MTPAKTPCATKRKRGRPRNPDAALRVVRAAQEFLASHDIDALVMDDLAWRVGMSKTTLYVHFRSKDALFDAAMRDALAQLPSASELTGGIGGQSVEARLLELGKRVGRLLSSARARLIRRALASGVSPGQRAAIRRTAGIPYLRAIRAYLRLEADRGCLALEDPACSTWSFLALVAGRAEVRYRSAGARLEPIGDAHLRRAVRVFVRAHAPRTKTRD